MKHLDEHQHKVIADRGRCFTKEIQELALSSQYPILLLGTPLILQVQVTILHFLTTGIPCTFLLMENEVTLNHTGSHQKIVRSTLRVTKEVGLSASI